MLYDCVKELKYRCFEEGETICRYGEIGEEFFIILKGEVSVEAPKTIEAALQPHLTELC